MRTEHKRKTKSGAPIKLFQPLKGTRPGSAQDLQTITTAPPAVDPRQFGLTKIAYSINEVLIVLSIGRTYLYRLIADGKLPVAKAGRKTLVYASDLAALLIEMRERAEQPDSDPANVPRRLGRSPKVRAESVEA